MKEEDNTKKTQQNRTATTAVAKVRCKRCKSILKIQNLQANVQSKRAKDNERWREGSNNNNVDGQSFALTFDVCSVPPHIRYAPPAPCTTLPRCCLCSPQRPQIPKQTKRQSNKLCELAPRQTGKWQKYPPPPCPCPLLSHRCGQQQVALPKRKTPQRYRTTCPLSPVRLPRPLLQMTFCCCCCCCFALCLDTFAISKRNARATCECYLAKAARATQSNQELVQYLRERKQEQRQPLSCICKSLPYTDYAILFFKRPNVNLKSL